MTLFSKHTSNAVSPTSGDRGRKYGPIAALTLAYIKGSRYSNRSANHWTYENCPVRTSER